MKDKNTRMPERRVCGGMKIRLQFLRLHRSQLAFFLPWRFTEAVHVELPKLPAN